MKKCLYWFNWALGEYICGAPYVIAIWFMMYHFKRDDIQNLIIVMFILSGMIGRRFKK